MTTKFFLVRHAAHDHVGTILTGRLPGISLGETGLAQAVSLAGRLEREQIDSVHASPRERARETAAAIRLGRNVEIAESLDEIDFGGWTGRSFADLDRDPFWAHWNARRSETRPPGGETMIEAQQRIVGYMERLRRELSDRAVALVSHCDVIKAAIAHYLGLPLDGLHRFEISPASVTTIVAGDWGGKVLTMNEVATPGWSPR